MNHGSIVKDGNEACSLVNDAAVQSWDVRDPAATAMAAGVSS
jgi:hypothetical protein